MEDMSVLLHVLKLHVIRLSAFNWVKYYNGLSTNASVHMRHDSSVQEIEFHPFCADSDTYSVDMDMMSYIHYHEQQVLFFFLCVLLL